MQADVETDSEGRDALLRDSAHRLEEAAARFAALEECGPRSDDFADCKSLLARTCIVSGDRRRARSHIDDALEILENDPGTKSWADAVIVDSELLALDGETNAANSRLNLVIAQFFPEGSEATEIVARAYQARARLRSRAHPSIAAADFERAADLYERLDDPDRAAASTVEGWSVADAPPRELTDVFQNESPLVKVEARRRYDAALTASSGRARSQRSGATSSKLRQIVDDARADAAALRPQW